MKIAVENITNWILVTGAIRSGTTFAGKVLSLPASVDYIHEPFNGGRSLPDDQPFVARYVPPDANDDDYDQQLSRIFSYDFTLNTYIHHQDPWWYNIAKSALGSRGPFYFRLARLNPFHTAAVIKDPTSKFVAERLHLKHGVSPVILVRHPASWIASLKRVGWWPGTREFANQTDLVKAHFSDEKDFLNKTWSSDLKKSAAHWRAAYKMLLEQADRYSNWYVVTHEELSSNPVSVFKHLYEQLDLPWSSRIERSITRKTKGSNSTEASSGRAMDLNRDSASIFEKRRDSLTREERREIFEIVEDIAMEIYPKESFALE